MPERLVTVGQVDMDGRRLRTLRIPPDAVPVARQHGWWVFDDFEDPGEPVRRDQADGYSEDEC